MIVIRIFQGIGVHFPTRVTEWALAVIMFNWGLRLLTTDDVFEVFPSFASMSNIMSESAWGIYCVAFALLRLAALIVNGTFRDSLYSKYSPMVRGACAALACFFWTQICIALLGTATPLSPGLSVYAVFVALEIYYLSGSLKEANRIKKEV